MTRIFMSTAASCLLLATAATAQDAMTDEELVAADEAAEVMFVEVYGDAVPDYTTATDAVARMEAMGYTNIHDFDVEWGNYEVEAIAPDGNEVEIEYDPVTGAILDVSDNWF
ncbi:PepSY domain-containing protein [Jannaschia formosa]|uniref:PepSY domain-containing protein n=1 Tax=Jannaschia formosa TaxID=2259592 RepID=UPI000E1C3B16|nr:PepSY domain-containing protein [Jannaschia formosa]TFL19666.1 PepSY domain-containing protein [Jannaschia formosa]